MRGSVAGEDGVQRVALDAPSRPSAPAPRRATAGRLSAADVVVLHARGDAAAALDAASAWSR